MGLKTDNNGKVHDVFFAYDQAVITKGAGDINYKARKLEEEYE
jgi:hypothetical protein